MTGAEPKPDTQQAKTETAVQEQNPQPAAPSLPEHEDPPIAFVNKVLSFAIVVMPACFAIVWAREWLIENVSPRIGNMFLFIGIAVFLLLLHPVAGKIQAFRNRLNPGAPENP